MYLVDIYESRSSYYNKNCYYNALTQDIHSGYALTQIIIWQGRILQSDWSI